MRMTGNFAQLLHTFFHEWLAGQRNNSCHTVRSYRDTWRLFLRFTAARQQRLVAALRLADLTAAEVLAFWTIARRNVTSPLARATAGWRRYGASSALSRTANRWPQANARRSCGFRSSGAAPPHRLFGICRSRGHFGRAKPPDFGRPTRSCAVSTPL